MKLCAKQRDGAALYRRYDKAQTPWQRLLASEVLDAERATRRAAIFQALDPVRLRRQLEALLDARWHHATFFTPVHRDGAHLALTPVPTVTFQHSTNSAPDPAPPLEAAGTGRRYRQTKKYQGPRWWRTRADPFAEVWAVMQERLATDPTRTAKALFHELQAEHPGRFPDIQLRTLQRRVQRWRATALLTFPATWLAEDCLSSAPIGAVAD